MNQPTNTDLMQAIREIHGDVRVALDRTVNQGAQITALSTQVHGHTADIASAKGHAAAIGTAISTGILIAIEIGKTIIRGPSPS